MLTVVGSLKQSQGIKLKKSKQQGRDSDLVRPRTGSFPYSFSLIGRQEKGIQIIDGMPSILFLSYAGHCVVCLLVLVGAVCLVVLVAFLVRNDLSNQPWSLQVRYELYVLQINQDQIGPRVRRPCIVCRGGNAAGFGPLFDTFAQDWNPGVHGTIFPNQGGIDHGNVVAQTNVKINRSRKGRSRIGWTRRTIRAAILGSLLVVSVSLLLVFAVLVVGSGYHGIGIPGIGPGSFNDGDTSMWDGYEIDKVSVPFQFATDLIDHGFPFLVIATGRTVPSFKGLLQGLELRQVQTQVHIRTHCRTVIRIRRTATRQLRQATPIDGQFAIGKALFDQVQDSSTQIFNGTTKFGLVAFVVPFLCTLSFLWVVLVLVVVVVFCLDRQGCDPQQLSIQMVFRRPFIELL